MHVATVKPPNSGRSRDGPLVHRREVLPISEVITCKYSQPYES